MYDLEADIGETTDELTQKFDVVKRLEKLAEKAHEDLGNVATGQEDNIPRSIGTLI